jgi:hypothetical protein
MESVSTLFRNLDDLYFAARLQQAQWQIRLTLLHRPVAKDGEANLRVRRDKVWGCTLPPHRLIILDSRLLRSEAALRIVLLHEMIHAKIADNRSWYAFAGVHGEEFLMELKRLQDEGEEHLEPEIRYYSRRRIADRPPLAANLRRAALKPSFCKSRPSATAITDPSQASPRLRTVPK